MKIKEVIKYIEEIAPSIYQEDYDNSGLIVGDENTEVSGVLLSLDITEDVIQEASGKGCNLIISHHPVIFKSIKNITAKTTTGRLLLKTIKENINIYAVHTNLDNTINGVNQILGEKLGLQNQHILKPVSGKLYKLVVFCPDMTTEKGIYIPEKVRKALFDAGAGVIGNYDCCSYNIKGIGTYRGLEGTKPFLGEKDKLEQQNEIRIETIFPTHLKTKVLQAMFETHPYEEIAYDIYRLENDYPKIGSGMIGELETAMNEQEFLHHLKKTLEIKMIRHSAFRNNMIKKVAFCGGAGAFLLKDAIQSGSDAFISADFKYHDFFDANENIFIADIGHFESEQFTIELLYEYLTKKINTFAVSKTMVKTNPINYF